MFTAEHRPLEVGASHPLRETFERVLSGTAQPDLGDDPLEFGRRRLRDLLRDRVERLEEAVARAERRRHDRQARRAAARGAGRRASTARSAATPLGTRRRRPRSTSARTQFRRSAAAKSPNTRHATADATTNSPDRSETPAASSSASSRSLNPLDSANRVPNFVTLSGIHPPVCGAATAGLAGLAGPAGSRRACARRGPDPASCGPRFPAGTTPSRNATMPDADPDQDLGRLDAECEHQTPFGSKANSSGSTYTPRSANLSRNFGRSPVDFRRPLNLPSSSTPEE